MGKEEGGKKNPKKLQLPKETVGTVGSESTDAAELRTGGCTFTTPLVGCPS
jgi:hypothetical protein